MSLKGKGRGTIIATEEGQGTNRIRIEGCQCLDGGTTCNLPTVGNLVDYVFYDPDTMADEFEEWVDWSTVTQVKDSDPNLEGKLIWYYWNDTQCIIAYYDTMAKGTTDGETFTVTDAGQSFASVNESYSLTRIKPENYSQDNPPRESVGTVSYDTDTDWYASFDHNNGTFDADWWYEA